jgi:polar amino acid transport system substrate-binding protein
LRAGLVENRPWVIRNDSGPTPTGIEVELVRRLAEQLDAEIEWRWGETGEHMEALKRFQLDLVAGGFTKASAWSTRVAFTKPYYTETIGVGVPEGAAPPDDLDGQPVRVRKGSVIAALLEEQDAVPVPVDDLWAEEGAVAAAEWELEARGWTVLDIELQKRKHCLAAPPGENGFLMELDRFLQDKASWVRDRLVEEAQP